MSRTETDQELELLDALIYGDVFGCAVTFDELLRYGREAVDGETLRLLLDDLVRSGVIVERDGLYCLSDRTELLGRRPGRMARGRTLRRRALRVARLIRKAPFVRGLLLTGSAAASDAGPDADVDLLVVVAPERLGIAFLLLGSASRLLGRRVLCPNYYVCEGQLDLPTGSLYLAREAAQAQGLVGDGRVIFDANPWLVEVFPNAAPPAPDSELAAGGLLQRALEAPLRGRLGDRLERRARTVATSRLRAHYSALGEHVPPDVAADLGAGRSLRFHGGSVDKRSLESYAARRAEVAACLAAASRSTAS